MARLVEAVAMGPPGPPGHWSLFSFRFPQLRENSDLKTKSACDHY
jgi:hypothetical protein